MKSWDVIIVGAGLIGLSLAISLRRQGLQVMVIERGEPGREASYAAAGMLAGSGIEIPQALRALAQASERSYPEFVRELEDESGIKVDLRDPGTILLSTDGKFPEKAEMLSESELHALEPALASSQATSGHPSERACAYLEERSVDPRALVMAALKAAKHRSVDISSGNPARALLISQDRVIGVQTEKSSYSAAAVINCAGAWAGCLRPYVLPVEPVKGQMLALVGAPPLKHVVRSPEVYLLPRSDGRLIIGSTIERAGYDKRTDVNVIRQFFAKATQLVPGIAAAKEHEAWAGLRPATPDGLPLLGAGITAGYFVSSGHFRDGILLAPISAAVMTDLVLSQSPAFDLSAFSPRRFPSTPN
jgi:glycine oxidase